MTGRRTPEQKILETLAHERCPCGHMKQRHRKPGGLIGEVMGECRDCDCMGLMGWSHEPMEAGEYGHESQDAIDGGEW